MSAFNIVLASSSPRRQALLRQVNIDFDVYAADIDETVRPNELPLDYVLRLAKEKALCAQYTFSMEHTIIAADTTVSIAGQILGKPENQEDAMRMWHLLSGQTHQVMTGVAVLKGDCCFVEVVTTDVTFSTLSALQMQQYWLSGEPLGKAGAYAIQGLAAAFISKINGSYSNVVGLPLFETLQLLQKI